MFLMVRSDFWCTVWMRQITEDQLLNIHLLLVSRYVQSSGLLIEREATLVGILHSSTKLQYTIKEVRGDALRRRLCEK